ncbi:LLM class flavin-dependent oxidoreductase [Planctomonas sp. JC2975]|uniref:LLM class flavin-dependent oxidoreductase n=1 Tax=Planctomonas sp. JC2975 TaxID=2729626 RepID=UPI0014764818|nr:LLM class flavin-dependent oxidoreductase [Planctomonas sp. JC2975]NNC11943.1 LLM class flavin-dependent oxidoreductase [Planctomonas sp. JC2975]
MTSVGAIFSPYPNPPEALHDAAIAAERAGLDELWLWEDCFRHSAFAAASAALAVTSTLRIGIGIAPMPLRNVAATAMEIATLARMFPGRLLPGIGHGVQSWMAQVDARPASPLTLMREYAPALRALLAGESVTTSGRYVTLDAVRLDWPPADVPLVYAAAEGPKTLLACGAVADGVVLNSLLTAEEAGRGVAAVSAGRAEAGRSGEHDVVAYAVAAFGSDGLDRARSMWTGEVPGDADERILGGSVDDVASGVRRFADAGVDHVVLLPPGEEPDLAAYFEQAGKVRRLVG